MRARNMRHERFEPREYANQELMNDLNEWCIALNVWLYPESIGSRLEGLQKRYPKPYIDAMMIRLMRALSKDSKPMIKY